MKTFDRHVQSCLMMETTRFVHISIKVDVDIALSMSSFVPGSLSPQIPFCAYLTLVWGEREGLGTRLDIDRVTYNRNGQGKTRLHEAAEKGDVEAVEKLLTDTTIDINSPTEMVRLHP